MPSTPTRFDPETLADHLETHDDAAGFDLAYRTDGEHHEVRLHDVSIVERTLQRPAAAPAVHCVPVDPTRETFGLRIDAIRALSPIDPPVDAYTPDDATKRETSRGLRRLASTAPGAVPAVRTTVHLETAITREERSDLLRAIQLATTENPTAFVPAIPTLQRELEIDDPVSPADCLVALRRIAEECPADVAPAYDAIEPYLDAATAEADGDDAATADAATADAATADAATAEVDAIARREAAHVAGCLADADATDVEPSIARLTHVVRDRDAGYRHATYAISAVSRSNVDAVEPALDALVDVVCDDDAPASVRSNAFAALGRLVGDDPRRGVDVVPHAVSIFDADHDGLRNNALGLVADVAKHHSDVVAPCVDDVRDYVAAADDATRVNATGLLARVAEDHPDAVSVATDAMCDRLGDENAVVRRNACDYLGHVDATTATERLQDRATGDDDATVRRCASRALDRIATRPISTQSD